MMRSMFSGVSGLKGHQTRMDVIGNNIANVNTTGFKASRVTFADMISQNLSGAASPNGNIGGVNPKQVGLGMSVASTDLIYTNGSVQQTGKNTDIAISRGDGLFVVKRGEQQFYTRNGAFSFDAEGNLTIPSTGLYVQGYMANNGVLAVGGDNTTKIQIPAGKSMEATPTVSASYTKNLNASTPGYEIANALVKYADGTSETVTNYVPNRVGRYALTMSTGQQLLLPPSSGAVQQSNAALAAGTLYTSRVTNVTATTEGGGSVDLNVDVDASNPSSPLQINGGTMPNPHTVSSGSYTIGGNYNISGKIRLVQTNTPSAGVTRLTLEANDNTIDPGNPVTVDVPSTTGFNYAAGQTYSGVLKINSITAKQGAIVTTEDGNRVTLATAVAPPFTAAAPNFTCNNTHIGGTITNIARTIVYENNGKTVSDISLNTKNGTTVAGLVGKGYAQNDTFYPSVATTIKVYDSLGAEHSVPVVFTKAENNKWALSLGSGGDTYTITEADGTTTTVALTKTDLTFDTTGAYTGGTASLSLTYTNGAAPQQVSMNLAAITQYAGTSTIAADSDGNAAGTLASVDIDSSGVITGTYTNGVRQKEAQIAMAQFNNPSGLTKMGGNLYQESNNSGTRTISGASDIGTELTTSALEMSNVDIADQFSDMIITQRGFQSNSKIITVSDEMLETLINMKR